MDRISLAGRRTSPGGAGMPGPSLSRARGGAAAVTAPAGHQAEGPSIARIYDYLLGGSHNFPADLEAATAFLARWPDARETMRANRAFLGRAVRYLAGPAGIRQFLDIGSGIPTMGNVHEIAQQTAPDARVVYVDNEEVAVLHSRAILARSQNATAIQADLRRPAEMLGSPQLLGLLDLSQPVALLLVAVLHFFPDSDQPAALVAELRDALAPGSCVVISHGTTDGQATHVAAAMGHYNQTTAPFQPRTRAEVLTFFEGLEMVDPGLVPVPLWRPDPPAGRADPSVQIAAYGGAGRKP
jgi:SAM-dependent methyltransferase